MLVSAEHELPRIAAQRTVLLARCPLCRGQDWQELASFPQLNWVRCKCALVYKRESAAEPRPERHGADYFGSAPGGRGYDRRHRRRIAKSRHQILDLLNHAPAGPLLDLGCSLGHTLQAAQALGLPCCGVDCSAFAVQHCREAGLQAERARLDALPFASGAFALVTMKHVLEQTFDPRAALAEVRRVLRPDGGLFIAVPHAGYHKARRDPQGYGFFRPERHGSERYVYYTPATLTRLLEEEGFTVQAVHPQLLHRHASPRTQAWQALFAPARRLAQSLADGLSLRKEFWLVARQGSSNPSRKMADGSGAASPMMGTSSSG